jgi:catechol 2,3-dioxygenase-like lactoylglutathione lyase family enzyme
MRLSLPLLLAFAAAAPALAQNQPAPPPTVTPNAAGVSFLHIHLYVRNVEAQRNFWLALAGAPQTGRGIRIGTASISINPGEPKGGNEGTSIDHAAFKVKNLKDTVAKLEAAGGKVTPGSRPQIAFVLAPEGVKLELLEDPSLEVPAVHDHVQLLLRSAAEALPWYRKWLGAEPGAGGVWMIPGTMLRITEGKAAPTSKGTSFDHIAFDVGDLAAFMKKLDEGALAHEPVTRIGNGTRGYTYITDPNGVYIELMGTLPPAAQ